MRVLIVGNCQVVPIAACLRELLPSILFDAIWLGSDSVDAIETARTNLGSYDEVFCHSTALSSFGGVHRMVPLPAINFTGFHPDDIVVQDIYGAIGRHHSAIGVCGFLLGFSPARSQRLFNRFIYASLGYVDEFNVAKERFLSQSERMGFDLRKAFEDWPMPFMHDPVHPKFEPIAALAKLIALRLGQTVETDLSAARESFEKQPTVSYPVYPEVAANLGLTQVPPRFRYPHTSSGFSLIEYLRKSFECYETVNRVVLEQVVSFELPILSGMCTRQR